MDPVKAAAATMRAAIPSHCSIAANRNYSCARCHPAAVESDMHRLAQSPGQTRQDSFTFIYSECVASTALSLTEFSKRYLLTFAVAAMTGICDCVLPPSPPPCAAPTEMRRHG
jgi:hypothetical protein